MGDYSKKIESCYSLFFFLITVKSHENVIIGHVGQLITIDHSNLHGLTQIPIGVPRWMILDRNRSSALPNHRMLSGVPLISDVGNYTFSPLLNNLKIQVVGLNQQNQSDIVENNCKHSLPTLVIVELDVDVASLPPAARVGILRGAINHLQLSPLAATSAKLVELSNIQDSGSQSQSLDLFSLASGPGNTATRRTQGTRLQWVLGCRAIDSTDLRSLELLEKSAVTGALSSALLSSASHQTSSLFSSLGEQASINAIPVLSWTVGDLRRALTPAQVDQLSRFKRSANMEDEYMSEASSGDGQLKSVGLDDGSGSSVFPVNRPTTRVFTKAFIKINQPTTISVSELDSSTIDSIKTMTRTIELKTTLKTTTTRATTTITMVPSTTLPRYTGPSKGASLSDMRCPVGLRNQYQIPEDAFMDAEDGNSRQLSLSLRCSFESKTSSGSTADNFTGFQSNRNWLVWQKDTQTISCVMPALVDIGRHQCTLSARDRDGNEINEAFYVVVVPPLSPKKKAAPILIATLVKGYSFKQVLEYDRFFEDEYSSRDKPLKMKLRLSKDEDLPGNLNLHYDPNTATLSAYPLAITPSGDYYMSLVATNRFEQQTETSVRLKISDQPLPPASHMFNLLLRSHVQLAGNVPRMLEIAEYLNYVVEPHKVRMLAVQQVASRRLRRRAIENQPKNVEFFFTEVKFDIPELHQPATCPASTLQMLRKRFFVSDGLCNRRPTPLFSRHLRYMTAINMSVDSLGPCREARMDVNYQCEVTTTLASTTSTTVSTTSLAVIGVPTSSINPPVINQSPIINYETNSDTGRQYCIMPFKVVAGYIFSRVLRRPNCVIDPEDGDMEKLEVMLVPSSEILNIEIKTPQVTTKADPTIKYQRDHWISFDRDAFSLKGMPLTRNVGNHTFYLRVFDKGLLDKKTGRQLPAKSVVVPFEVQVDLDPDPYKFHKFEMKVKSVNWNLDHGAVTLFAQQLAILLGQALNTKNQDTTNTEEGKIYIGDLKKVSDTETIINWAWSQINGNGKDNKCPLEKMHEIYQLALRGRVAAALHNLMHLQEFALFRMGDCLNYQWNEIYQIVNCKQNKTGSSKESDKFTKKHVMNLADDKCPLYIMKQIYDLALRNNLTSCLRNLMHVEDFKLLQANDCLNYEWSDIYQMVHRKETKKNSAKGSDFKKSSANNADESNKERHFLMTTILPACALIVTALSVGVVVACCIQRQKGCSHRRGRYQMHMDTQGGDGKDVGGLGLITANISCKSTALPPHMCEKLDDRHIMIAGKPLILPNEKPPLAPPNYAFQDPDEPLLHDYVGGMGSLRKGHSTFGGQAYGQAQTQPRFQSQQYTDSGIQQAPTVRVYLPA